MLLARFQLGDYLLAGHRRGPPRAGVANLRAVRSGKTAPPHRGQAPPHLRAVPARGRRPLLMTSTQRLADPQQKVEFLEGSSCRRRGAALTSSRTANWCTWWSSFRRVGSGLAVLSGVSHGAAFPARAGLIRRLISSPPRPGHLRGPCDAAFWQGGVPRSGDRPGSRALAAVDQCGDPSHPQRALR